MVWKKKVHVDAPKHPMPHLSSVKCHGHINYKAHRSKSEEALQGKGKVYIGVNKCNDIVAPKFIINKLQTTDSVIFDEFWYRTL